MTCGVGAAVLGIKPLSAVAATGSASKPGAGPAIPRWPSPTETRQIWIQSAMTGERIVARYFSDGKIDMTQYLYVCRILRDVTAGVAAYIDVELLDLMFAMQRWLVAWGIDRPLIIHSGFRTTSTNATIDGAARNSRHLYGQAADIHMPGVPANYLGQLASVFRAGGIGFYTNKRTTHVDTGSVRYWRSDLSPGGLLLPERMWA